MKKLLLLLVSVLLFSLNLYSQVTLTAPNGGENLFIGSNDTIRWQAPSTTNVNVSYSTDGGVTWMLIASNVSSVIPSFIWTVPSTVSILCKVKIIDTLNDINFDESDGYFTITDKPQSALTLTYPNGGEIIYNGSQQNITWTSSNVGAVNIYFSPDNGVTWNSIVSNVPAFMGSYSSTVNSNSTNTALIRISDAIDAATFDECDRVFTILDTTKNIITISFPNGGENWQVGSNQFIAWTNTNMAGAVNIDYSIDNGTTWLSVATNLPSMYPTYMWTIPNTPSASCKIKVYDASDASVFDESDLPFTITASQTGGVVALYKFDGNAVDGTGNGHDGTVNGAMLVADRFSNPNSAYLFSGNSSIKVPHSPELNFNGQFTFAVWLNQAGNQNAFNCILGKDYTNEFGFGTWGSNCTLPTYPRLIIGNTETTTANLSPINCNTWTHLVVTFDDATDQVQFFVNGSLTETAMNTGAITPTTTDMGIGQDGKYMDQFYGSLDDIRIFNRVLSLSEIQAIYNDSGNQTQILKLEAPNGGELLVAGTTDTIHWSANYLTQVKLDYTTDYGATWTNIGGSLPSEYPSGYAWTVPNTASTMCKVRVTDNNNPTMFDESDSAFTIQLFKSGEYIADANTILLDHFNGTTTSSILAYTQTGQSCGSALPSATPSSFFNPGMNELYQALTLNPPIDALQGSATYLKYPGGQLLSQANGTIEFWVRLSSYGKGLDLVTQTQYYGACYGWTFEMHLDSIGTLASSAWAAFSLNSGENKVPLGRWTHLAVSWGSTGAKLYIDGMLVGSDANRGMPADGYGGSLHITLGTGAGVSNTIDELRVSNIQRTEFNIIPQKYLSVVSPNGGENLLAGKIDSIRWTSSNATILNIEYSTDNGTSWISVYPAIPASVGSAPWLIPNTPSPNCKVRISDATNAALFDESDTTFNIVNDSLQIGLVAFYPFNNNTIDESGNGNNGTNNGATPAFDRFNNPNSALSFDGNTNFVLVPSSASLNVQNSITLSAWIKTDNPHIIQDVNPGSVLAKHETVQTRQYDLFFYSTSYDSLHFDLVDQRDNFTSDQYFFATTTPSVSYRNNQWHMVVGTYDYNTGFSQIYIDGVPTSARYLGQINLMQTNVPLTIGCYSEQNSNFRGFYQGIIDDIRIYDRSLSQQEISMLYYEKGYTPNSLTLTTPAGGEVFQANSLVPIEWSASNVYNFSLEYTSDNGASWSLICDTLTAASTGFLWYTPFIESDVVRVRISDKNNPATFDECDSNFTITNKITQVVPLYYSGWNMISFYVQPVSSLPRDVFPSPLVLQVKTELQSFDPALPEFLNTLKSINASQGYLVKTDSAEHSFPVIGTHFYPADGISYRAGWNLMSYYYSYGESVWNAFNPIMASVEEIKSLTGYFNPLGAPETNTLFTLEPGEAYWLKLKNNIDGYVLPSPLAIMPKKHQTIGQKLMVDLPWKLKGYTQSTVAIFTVTSDGKPVSAGTVVAAFVNNECRAISEVKLNSEGTAFATLVINGDKEEEASFKIFDAVKKEAFGSNLKMKTKPGTTIPGIQELPFTFVTGIEDPILPTTTTLMNAYPNPFNPETRIRYSLNKDQHVSLKIYDVLGKEVITLVDDTKNAGYYEVSFDASGLPSGIYFYRMQSGEYVSVKKILLLK